MPNFLHGTVTVDVGDLVRKAQATLIDKWGSQENYDRDTRIAWAASTPHVRALIGAMRMVGRKMHLREPLKGGVPEGFWHGFSFDYRAFEVDFKGMGRIEVEGLAATTGWMPWETMWVREETWPWIVEHIIVAGGDLPRVSISESLPGDILP